MTLSTLQPLPYCAARVTGCTVFDHSLSAAHAQCGTRAERVMSKSVLIVDDSPLVRRVINNFFSTLTDWTIAGEAEDGAEAARKAIELKPDLVLLDFSMPNMNGIEAASVIKNALPDVYIIVFTMFDDAVGSRLSSAVGVDLIIPKTEGLTHLVEAVQRYMGIAGLINGRAETNHHGAN